MNELFVEQRRGKKEGEKKDEIEFRKKMMKGVGEKYKSAKGDSSKPTAK
ncbi:MAG: hypothetical protein Q8P67_28480 [archaeon]|nr:hypothetical protein [archaeon]